MARLTAEQWETVKADYATGRYTNRELSERHNTSHTAIQNRAKKEGWHKVDAETVNDFVKAKIAINDEVSKVSKVSKIDSGKFEDSLSELAQFEIESNKAMKKIDEMNLAMLHSAENPNQVKAIMETHIKHREARLGKNPDTAIQINNTETPRVIKIV